MFDKTHAAFPDSTADCLTLLETVCKGIAPVSPVHLVTARQRLDSLTKPLESLGKLENVAEKFAGIQEGRFPLRPEPAVMFTVAGDHGVVEEGIAAVPQTITAQMTHNFLAGGAGINALCRHGGIDLVVVDAGVKADLPESPMLVSRKIAYGTANFTKGPAMTEAQCLRALGLGIALARSAAVQGYNALGLGEMGIGNTTSSTALLCALLGFSPEVITGSGAGIPKRGLAHKQEVIAEALAANRTAIQRGRVLPTLAALGGLEIATLAGLILGGAEQRLAVMVDGFISTAAFVAARAFCPIVGEYCFFSHESAESGHVRVLAALGQEPLLNLGMRLGEGTGAALGLSLLGASAAIYNDMATFVEARVRV